jgi:hypothetical protein
VGSRLARVSGVESPRCAIDTSFPGSMDPQVIYLSIKQMQDEKPVTFLIEGSNTILATRAVQVSCNKRSHQGHSQYISLYAPARRRG